LIIVAIVTTFALNSVDMDIGSNIKRLREEKGIKQQEIAELINMHRSNYSKIENGQREISVAALDKIAQFFDITIDELIHMGDDLPQEVDITNKSALEQMKMIQDLDEEDKQTIFKMIETFLTKKKFKDFFNKNVAAL